MRLIVLASLSLLAAAQACSAPQIAAPQRDCVGAPAPDGGPVEAMKWVDGDEKPCGVVCESAGMHGVYAGTYGPTHNPLFVCVGDPREDGLRPGYNVMPDYADRCTVGWGGQELGAKPYQCLCQK